jgi:hypothetical protein
MIKPDSVIFRREDWEHLEELQNRLEKLYDKFCNLRESEVFSKEEEKEIDQKMDELKLEIADFVLDWEENKQYDDWEGE